MGIRNWSSAVCCSDLRLRGVGGLSARDVGRSRSGDDDVVLEIDRTRRLGEGRRGKQRDRNQRDAGGKRVTKFHVRMSPWWLAVGGSVRHARDNLAGPLTPLYGMIVTVQEIGGAHV